MICRKQLHGKTTQGGRLQELKSSLIIHKEKKTKEVTVEPPLTVTSLQWPFYFVSADKI